MEPQTSTPVRKPISSMSVLGARITWTLLGPVGLFFATVAIVMQGTGWLTGLDLLFAGIVGLILVGRWIEHRSGSGTTLSGEPESANDYQRYMIVFPIALAVVWVVANVLGNHVLAG